MVTKPAGQIRRKSLVRTNANDWSGRMQAGGQVECNFALKGQLCCRYWLESNQPAIPPLFVLPVVCVNGQAN